MRVIGEFPGFDMLEDSEGNIFSSDFQKIRKERQNAILEKNET
jgi:hypothetical protein